MRAANCSSCRASIVWMKTAKEKTIPVDLSSVPARDMLIDGVVFRPGEHISHFATCPNADKHRKRK